MRKISNSKLLTIFTKLLVLVFIAKAISLALWFYLPSDGIELNVSNSYKPKYQRVDFKNMLEKIEIKKKIVEKVKQKVVVKGPSITNMILKGLYGTDTKGFAIIALKSKPKKTTIVGIDELYEGYILKNIQAESVVLVKNEQEYILELLTSKNSSNITKVKSQKNSNKQITSRASVDIDDSDEPRDVTRADIAYYAKNPKKIWKDISIREIKENGRIKGFKITKIKPRSKFAQLGLQRGDLIIRANNITLTSYRDAIKLYNNISKIDTMQIVVIRDNQEKELVYEIN